MARKKKQEDPGLGTPWMNTFADLMNLLLCFFVLLFSMSNVDAEKYEAIVTSMQNKINILPGGDTATGEGPFASSGTDQLIQIEEYFAEFEESGNPTESEQEGEDETSGKEGYSPEEIDKEMYDKYEQQKFDTQKEVTEELAEEIRGVLEKYQLTEVVGVNLDDGYQYVQLSIKGAFLFDSGKADIKKENIKIIDKLGDLLKIYENHTIKIQGHTDNVPIHKGLYKNNNWLSQARAITVAEYLMNEKNIKPETLEWSGRGEYEPIGDNDTVEGRAKNRRVEIKIYSAEE